MGVYIGFPEKAKTKKGIAVISYLVADTCDELHLFADKIGLDRKHFQSQSKNPHYRLIGAKIINKATRAGACLTWAEIIDYYSRKMKENPV